jgi:hypothetical protein
LLPGTESRCFLKLGPKSFKMLFAEGKRCGCSNMRVIAQLALLLTCLIWPCSTPNGTLSHASSDAAAAAAATAAATTAAAAAAAAAAIDAGPHAMLSPRSDSSHYSSARSEGGTSVASGASSPTAKRVPGGGGGAFAPRLAAAGAGKLETAASMDGIELGTPAKAAAKLAEGVHHALIPASAAAAPLHAGAATQPLLSAAAVAAAATSAAADVRVDPDAVPAGVSGAMLGGECLLHYPDRPLNVPLLQVRPAV